MGKKRNVAHVNRVRNEGWEECKGLPGSRRSRCLGMTGGKKGRVPAAGRGESAPAKLRGRAWLLTHGFWVKSGFGSSVSSLSPPGTKSQQ